MTLDEENLSEDRTGADVSGNGTNGMGTNKRKRKKRRHRLVFFSSNFIHIKFLIKRLEVDLNYFKIKNSTTIPLGIRNHSNHPQNKTKRINKIELIMVAF